jgi:hypothetical protein
MSSQIIISEEINDKFYQDYIIFDDMDYSLPETMLFIDRIK